ncbi:hypothetical protein C8R41DRAFT_905473 [Lentinula lateritia]|uniref:Uncharacterized protein n=1 Tax=Lentinula lateritia TaxID=40482 RepID=A0ABQ8V346_9AGAR|nr:hypothetical protein C8R41DRAFT_905473 [Lentinula lateritia]
MDRLESCLFCYQQVPHTPLFPIRFYKAWRRWQATLSDPCPYKARWLLIIMSIGYVSHPDVQWRNDKSISPVPLLPKLDNAGYQNHPHHCNLLTHLWLSPCRASNHRHLRRLQCLHIILRLHWNMCTCFVRWRTCGMPGWTKEYVGDIV